MRTVNYTLRPAVIDAAKPRDTSYALTDGAGLHVEILPSGAKVWRYKYHFGGRREKVTLGGYPAHSLKAARDWHAEQMALVERGESPAAAKRAAQATPTEVLTFRAFALVWVEETMHYRAPSYRAQMVRWLDQHICPHIGAMPLDRVAPGDVLRIIEATRATPTTSDGCRSLVQRVYNYAIRKLLVTTNPAAPLVGAIVVPPKTHHRHLSEPELARFIACLATQRAHAGTVACTRLLMLTMVRKSEARLARWREFDLESALWDIPADRMKMRKGHRVYLSTQAVDLLRGVHLLTGGDPEAYVFPSIYRRTVPLGDATINHLFSRMDFGVAGFAPHGLRGTAATILREHGFSRDVVELLLAHVERDQSAAAYSHHELAGERRRALQWLADRIDSLA